MKKNSTVSYMAPIIKSVKISASSVLMQSGGGFNYKNNTENIIPDEEGDLC